MFYTLSNNFEVVSVDKKDEIERMFQCVWTDRDVAYMGAQKCFLKFGDMFNRDSSARAQKQKSKQGYNY